MSGIEFEKELRVEKTCIPGVPLFDLPVHGDAVVPVTTAEYYAGAEGPIAPRPENSDLDLSKLTAAGFVPRDWEEELEEYLDELLA